MAAGPNRPDELADIDRAPMTALAEEIVTFQREVARLPLGAEFGWAPINGCVAVRRVRHKQRRHRPLGQPIVTVEINARDFAKLKRFYTELFGWEIDEPNQWGWAAIRTGNERGRRAA